MNDELKLGHHTEQEREEFINRKTAKYLERHQGVKRKKARKYAKVKWARKINSEIQRTKHVNHPRIKKIEVKEES